jgi:hypothetical protein
MATEEQIPISVRTVNICDPLYSNLHRKLLCIKIYRQFFYINLDLGYEFINNRIHHRYHYTEIFFLGSHIDIINWYSLKRELRIRLNTGGI